MNMHANLNLRSVLRRLGASFLLAVLILDPAAAQAQKKVLVVTVTKGYRHSSIATAEKVLGQLAGKSGVFTVDYVRTEEEMASKMTAEALKDYDAFIFANTTGDLPLPDKDAFIAAINSGKGFVGMHSCSDTFHGYRPFIDMLGGEFQTHGAQAGVECLVQDPQHPAVRHFGEAFCIQQEEIYLMKSYDPKRVHELLMLDKHPNQKKTAGRFPISWCRLQDKGKVFYTSLGHNESVWETPAYQQHILGGLKWALGLEPGDATPQAK